MTPEALATLSWLRGPICHATTFNGRRAQVRRVVMGDGSRRYQVIVDGAARGVFRSLYAAKSKAAAVLQSDPLRSSEA